MNSPSYRGRAVVPVVVDVDLLMRLIKLHSISHFGDICLIWLEFLFLLFLIHLIFSPFQYCLSPFRFPSSLFLLSLAHSLFPLTNNVYLFLKVWDIFAKCVWVCPFDVFSCIFFRIFSSCKLHIKVVDKDSPWKLSKVIGRPLPRVSLELISRQAEGWNKETCWLEMIYRQDWSLKLLYIK